MKIRHKKRLLYVRLQTRPHHERDDGPLNEKQHGMLRELASQPKGFLINRKEFDFTRGRRGTVLRILDNGSVVRGEKDTA